MGEIRCVNTCMGSSVTVKEVKRFNRELTARNVPFFRTSAAERKLNGGRVNPPPLGSCPGAPAQVPRRKSGLKHQNQSANGAFHTTSPWRERTREEGEEEEFRWPPVWREGLRHRGVARGGPWGPLIPRLSRREKTEGDCSTCSHAPERGALFTPPTTFLSAKQFANQQVTVH
ncbi:hypothetical protein AAFF_G00264110 [Aldrovandia affinis]|uniref:Uncharacterized protein n=1 Tax=Aldrovandia affinis TaxID=143900 RepID=A0AAD7SU17_9TELE|nr:hypothetical protein AAFF_G00264110 [Aldrovandia affinis]